jgi:hypothetical protein
VYTKGLVSESKAIPDATTDHRPVVTTVRAGGRCPGTTKLVSLKRQNFQAITRGELEGALNHTDWTRVYAIRDVDDILDFITAGIVSALDIIAPEKEIRVKSGPNLYLTLERLETMRKRDLATGRRYRELRNEVSRLVRRDKPDSNLLSLKKAGNNPKVLWHLADQALGKDRPSLPASITGANSPTETPMEAAEVMNQFFLDKVDDLQNKKHYSPDCRRRRPTLLGRSSTSSRRPATSRRKRPTSRRRWPTSRRRSTTTCRRPTTTPCLIATSAPPSTSSSRTRRGCRRR